MLWHYTWITDKEVKELVIRHGGDGAGAEEGWGEDGGQVLDGHLVLSTVGGDLEFLNFF